MRRSWTLSRTDGFMEFAAGRAGHLHRSACLLTSGDTDLAEDLVQETLSRMYTLWDRMSRIAPAGNSSTSGISARARRRPSAGR